MSGCGCGNGNNCTDGLNGLNAFTVTTANFTQPAVGSNVTVSVSVSGQLTGLWAVAGQVIFIQVGGFYEVVSVNQIGSQITVKNLGVSGYAAPAATISSGNKVSPAGYQGQAGVSVVSAAIVGGNLILTLSDGSTINAGAVVGSAGVNQLFNTVTPDNFTGTGTKTYTAYSMPSGTFATNLSTLDVEATFSHSGNVSTDLLFLNLLFGATSLSDANLGAFISKGIERSVFNFKIERVSATSVNVTATVETFGGNVLGSTIYPQVGNKLHSYRTGVVVSNLDSTTLNVAMFKNNTTQSCVSNLIGFKVRYFKLG